jgi:hypothetical protein
MTFSLRLAIGALLISMPANPTPAAELLLTGDQVTIKTGWIGCRDGADLERAIDLAARQRDIEAAAAYTSARDCRSMGAGTAGILEDVSAWHGRACVRQRGEPYCYWFPLPFLAKVN